VQYKGQKAGEARLDLLVDDNLVVELKAVEDIAPLDVAQILSDLKATRLAWAYSSAFNVTTLRRGIKRVIHTPQKPWRSPRLGGSSLQSAQ
jgi:GxxExxY protein